MQFFTVGLQMREKRPIADAGQLRGANFTGGIQLDPKIKLFTARNLEANMNHILG